MPLIMLKKIGSSFNQLLTLTISVGLVTLLSYPIVTPLVSHGITTLFAILFLISLISYAMSAVNGDNFFKKTPKWIFPFLLIYPTAIIIQDIYFQHWDGESFDAASHFLLGVLLIPFICSIPTDKLKWINYSMAAAPIITLIYLVTHQNLLVERAATEFMGPTRLPHYISIFTILSVPLLAYKSWQKWLGIIGLLAAAVIVLFSQTRGAWLGAFLVTLFFIYYQFQHSLKKFFVAISALSLAILLIITLGSPIRDRVKIALNEVNHKVEAQSIVPRLMIWKMTTDIIKEHPIVGIGRNHFVEARDQLIQEKKYPEYLKELPHPHNELLYAWVETGFIGFIGMLLFYALPGQYFWKIWRKNDPSTKLITFCGLNVIFYYFFAGLSDIVIIASNLKASLYVLNIGVLVALIENQKTTTKQS